MNLDPKPSRIIFDTIDTSATIKMFPRVSHLFQFYVVTIVLTTLKIYKVVMALLCIASLLGSAVGSPINATTADSTLEKRQTPKQWYSGDGTVAAGWPDQSQWLSFGDL